MTAKTAKTAKTVKAADIRRILILNPENPHRAGSARANAFETAKACDTVSAYREAGRKLKYLDVWAASKHLRIEQ